MDNKNSVCVCVCVCVCVYVCDWEIQGKQRDREKERITIRHELIPRERERKILVFLLCSNSCLKLHTHVHNHGTHNLTLPPRSLPTNPRLLAGRRWSMLKSPLSGCELLQRESTNQWLISSPARGEADRGRQVNDGEMRREKTEAGKPDNGEEEGGEVKEIRVRIIVFKLSY